MQRTLTQTLAYTTDDCFLFEDALGRSARLPYIFFKEWEVRNKLYLPEVTKTVQVFEARLCTEFRSVPGLIKVTSGQYLILSSSNAENDINGRLIQKSDWSTMVLPKSKVTMSMIIAQLRGQHGLCPRPSCGSRKFDEISGSNFLRWYDPRCIFFGFPWGILLTSLQSRLCNNGPLGYCRA